MSLFRLTLGFLCVQLASCGSSPLTLTKPEIDVEVINQYSRDLENTTARFGPQNCEWGSVGKTFAKIHLFYPHPITPEAELSWDEPGGHRVEKIDLRKFYSAGKSGRLTFTVFDDRVDVSFRDRSAGP
jgi:hypothetical protein